MSSLENRKGARKYQPRFELAKEIGAMMFYAGLEVSGALGLHYAGRAVVQNFHPIMDKMGEFYLVQSETLSAPLYIISERTAGRNYNAAHKPAECVS